MFEYMPASQISIINNEELLAGDANRITMNQDIYRTKIPRTFIDKIKALRNSAKYDRTRMLDPFIYHCLKDFQDNPHVPDETVAELEQVYYQTAASNIKKLYSATKILQIFHQEGIFAIPLKGMALIETVYKNPAIRPMADIDLLIRQEDAQKVKDILINMGYPYIDSYRGSINFADSENEVFDLHSKFTRFEVLFHIDYAEIYSRLRKINFNGQIRVGVLCPEHQLIHIALHLAPGLYSGLNFINLIDMYYLIIDQDCPFDWEYLIGFSTRSKMNSYIYGPIYLCTHLFDQKIPESVLKIFQARLSKRKSAYIQNDYFGSILDRGSSGLKIFFERVKWAEGFPNKMKLIRMALFPDRQEMAQRYSIPENSLRLYGFYIARIVKLLREILK
jgi:hypothetical protein